MFQNITQIVKNKLLFNDFKQRRMSLSCSKKIISIETKPELHKKVCKNKDFCSVVMPPEDTRTLEFNQYHKSDREPIIINFPDL